MVGRRKELSNGIFNVNFNERVRLVDFLVNKLQLTAL